MAMLSQDQTELEKQGQGIKQPGSGSGGVVGTTGASSMQPKSAESGQWTNLSQYRDANKGAAGKMTNLITGDINKQYGDIQGNIGKSGEEYRSSVISPNLEREKSEYNVLSDYASGKSSSPSESTWREQGGGNVYADVTTPYNTTDIDKNIRDYYDKVMSTGSVEGRGSLLKNIQPQQSTRGEGLLNQYLMQTSPIPQTAFGDIRERGTSELTSALSGQQDINRQALNELTGLQQTNIGKADALIPRSNEDYQALLNRVTGWNEGGYATNEPLSYDQWAQMEGSGYLNNLMSKELTNELPDEEFIKWQQDKYAEEIANKKLYDTYKSGMYQPLGGRETEYNNIINEQARLKALYDILGQDYTIPTALEPEQVMPQSMSGNLSGEDLNTLISNTQPPSGGNLNISDLMRLRR